jgi:hypothetical protein
MLVLLHTGQAHVATFDGLLERQAPDVPAEHVVEQALLDDARREGMTPEIERRIEARLRAAFEQGATTVLCTCSTIGGSAEAIGRRHGWPVLRVDRAMAAMAVALGPRITVAAALASTLEPTCLLIEDEAQRANASIQLTSLLCQDAWELFEAGALEAYHQRIATCIRGADLGDVVVLAQASMAGAAPLLADLDVPVLSSPALGLEAAVAAYRSV